MKKFGYEGQKVILHYVYIVAVQTPSFVYVTNIILSL